MSVRPLLKMFHQLNATFPVELIPVREQRAGMGTYSGFVDWARIKFSNRNSSKVWVSSANFAAT